ncbi:glucan biosynthesis protein G [Neptunomonas phycophila]|uniref:Glucans biosynthesis protein G n=1 Tax=Neptunomonas phycophila TaxID=1572645 RepID=A0ABT9EU88_9GAMM|nr:glucan biosynthesis protein G [Neptunomonas phycophila]MDO6468483.1 glucan biosynthesis protein G [Neptunomonas phycophila]MDP2522490.1 glucan biosynthesis protein G [Neptunomonas phycophila]
MFNDKKQSSSVFSRALIGATLCCAATLPVKTLAADAAKKAATTNVAATQFAVSGKFNRDTVTDIARQLAKKPYKAPEAKLPESLEDLNYDQYRDIRFNPSSALWTNENVPFQLQMFHRGFYYKDPVEIAVIEDGQAKHLSYSSSMFKTGEVMKGPLPKEDIGFAGFRIHSPINRDDYFDEVAVFQGASYLRSLGKNQSYGLSSRGLALKTADPEGEEFPVFRAYWIEKPVADSRSIVVYALLDSPSTTGAYRFTIRPGTNTVMDVEATLFPRVDLTKVGLAAGTSMFMFSSYDRDQVDDFRPRVHDSDGLLMLNGRGEHLWRPLLNHDKLNISSFLDNGPLGFGLVQRDRNFDHYQDLEAHYEKRPSLWVEPVGNWGKGMVKLIEIPSDSEIHDNIVAYWSPADVIPAKTEYSFAYRLVWGEWPTPAPSEGIVTATRNGRADISGPTPERLFVIDYEFPNALTTSGLNKPTAKVKNQGGKVKNIVVRENPKTGGYRVSFELDPEDADLVELRMDLQFDDNRKAESWMYQWSK